MGLEFVYTPGQSPIDEDEKEGLLIGSISTLAELNQAEYLNIQNAIEWALNRRRFQARDILSETFVRELHKRMFRDVWRWAGEFRKTNKNIGVDKLEIQVHLRQLIDDAKFWQEHNTFSPDEMAIRFKHRIVSIHCFPNGNGRHSRLMADIIAQHIFASNKFNWGAVDFTKKTNSRQIYLDALHGADKNDLSALIRFARS